jgi:hypothetical protein
LDRIKNYIAHSKLLKLKNDVWLEEGEQLLTASDFTKRISAITSVNAYYENGFNITFEDDDIFWGHEIQVMISKSFEFEEAQMVG